MVQKFIKFIKKSPNRKRFEKILQDILDNNVDGYNVQAIQGKKWYFRLRVWIIRFVYKKAVDGNVLMSVNGRSDVYKKI